MRCPNCGKINKEGEAFCVECGAAIIITTAKAQKNVQQAVDAYSSAAKKTEQKNIVPTIIIIFLSLVLVISLILLAPIFMDLLKAPDKTADEDPADTPSDIQASEEEVFSSNPYYECYRAHDEYVFPNSSSVYLTRADLKDLSAQELDIALYEIYARHGERFRDPDVQAYFEQRGWYTPASGALSDLNTYEAANEILLQVYIAQQTGTFTQPGNPYLRLFTGTDSFAARNSHSRYLEAEDLKDLDEDQLIIARNEIHARHGYVFTDPELQAYFCTKTWYEPSTTAIAENIFNEYEKNNIQLIELYERKLDGIDFSMDNPYLDYYTFSDSYILADSDSAAITDYDLTDFTVEKCVLARNEIFARHGYVFTDEQILDYFLLQAWYEPGGKIGDTSEISLNSTEKKNMEILQDTEKILGSLPELNSLNHTPTVTVAYDAFSVKLPAYWSDYGVHDSSNMKFYEKLSHNSSLAEDGYLFSFTLLPAGQQSQMPSWDRLGTLTDPNGVQYDLIAVYPTDVRSHTCARELYSAMRNDLQSIFSTVTPAEGYTYTP